MSALPGVGFEYPCQDVSWTKRDALLFAWSIGCTEEELHFLYELHPNFQLFPTYALVLPFKLNNADVTDFYTQRDSLAIPNVPRLDSRRVVDGGRRLTILKPLPTRSGTQTFKLRSTILGVYDKGAARGTVVEKQDEIFDAATGEVYTRGVGSDFFVGQGGWGGPRGSKPPVYSPPAGRAPDVSVEVQTRRETALLYRLNGDYNPLHATREPGVAMGFGDLILHGLFSWNCAARAVLKHFAGSKSDRLVEFQARFASPVKPGDRLVIEMWSVGSTAEGLDEVRFIASIGGGRTCLTNGRALLKGSSLSRL